MPLLTEHDLTPIHSRIDKLQKFVNELFERIKQLESEKQKLEARVNSDAMSYAMRNDSR